ncbi:MAG TPA: glycosyl hydrolase family 18 protein, partial [Bacteroidia bacterium]|nr:glycosyl hydrolase family 18 protein [Bacteroidia bacterium]
MKRRISNFIYFLILFVLSVQFVAAEPCREVVGYFAGWKWYKRNKLVNPESIDYSKFTIINYAFFKPLENGTVTEGDSWADHIILKGKLKKVNGNMVNDPSSSLVFKAHSHGVKVVGSVGGWSWSSVFPGIAADPVKRMQFAASCVDIIEKYNLDGIDIDWEYPGHKAHNGSAADKQNFTLLLQTIRNSLNAYEKISGRKMLLTGAFGPAPNHMEQIEWEKVTPLLDIIHMMTYNYYGACDKTANHNCPLFKPLKANAAYNIDATLKTLNEIYNVPLSKITLGLAFYGRSVIMNNESGLFDTSTGRPDDVTFPEEKGTPSYY